MSYGIKIVGSHGAIQVDDQFKNMARIASGSVVNQGVVSIQVPISQGAFFPQLFVRPFADGMYVGALDFITSNPALPDAGAFRLHTNYKAAQPSQPIVTTPGVGFDWVMFGYNGAQLLDNSQYAVVVRDAAGATTFDSRWEVARVQTTAMITQPPNDGNQQQTYSQLYGFSGWGTRPWFCINPLIAFDTSAQESGNTWGVMATTEGLGGLRLNMCNHSYSGDSIGWVPKGPATGNLDIALLRRYTD